MEAFFFFASETAVYLMGAVNIFSSFITGDTVFQIVFAQLLINNVDAARSDSGVLNNYTGSNHS